MGGSQPSVHQASENKKEKLKGLDKNLHEASKANSTVENLREATQEKKQTRKIKERIKLR